MSADDKHWTGKQRWHQDQRLQSPRDKIRLLIELQRREAELDKVRVSLGRPPRGIQPWQTTP